MLKNELPQTLQQAIQYYSDRDRCEQTLAAVRWPDGVTCPHCGSKRVSYLKNQRRWNCAEKHPKRQFSVKIGTIFEESPVGLDKWFTAIWLIESAKNGISSYEIHRAIGVTQKTAWFMLHRIRLAMQAKRFDRLGGEVEVDETFIGGKARNMHKDKREQKIHGRGPVGKAAVMGLLERHGKDGHSTVRAKVVQGRRKKHVKPQITEHVEPGASVYTDELKSYDSTLDKNYAHQDHAECSGQPDSLQRYGELLEASPEARHQGHLRPSAASRSIAPVSRRRGTPWCSTPARHRRPERFNGALKSVAGRRDVRRR